MSPFYAIESFLDALTNTCDDGRVVIHAACGTKSAYFKFMQLNPAVHFKQIVDEARSVILAGGTMSPVSRISGVYIYLFYAYGIDLRRYQSIV